jgi:hypothetical protein
VVEAIGSSGLPRGFRQVAERLVERAMSGGAGDQHVEASSDEQQLQHEGQHRPGTGKQDSPGDDRGRADEDPPARLDGLMFTARQVGVRV